MARYYEKGLIMTIQRLNDGEWKIRNSALNLYSFLVKRSVGDFDNAWRRGDEELIETNETSTTAVNAKMFFHMYPTMLDFVRMQLDGKNENDMHAVLSLLASFRRDGEEQEEEEAIYSLLPLIQNIMLGAKGEE